MPSIAIRPERADDRRAIRTVVEAAFANRPYSNQTEGRIVDALRAAGALTMSLVATDGDAVVGHIAFSPVTIGGKAVDWYGLGPVAVRPDLQRKGIGSALINEGLTQLRARAAQGCILLGDPAYYSRFGFKVDPPRCPEDLPGQYFHVLPFGPTMPSGKFAYHTAFATA